MSVSQKENKNSSKNVLKMYKEKKKQQIQIAEQKNENYLQTIHKGLNHYRRIVMKKDYKNDNVKIYRNTCIS